MGTRPEGTIQDSLELKASRAEVYWQPYFKVVCLQVVNRLRQVNVLLLEDGFQFDGDNISNQEIDSP